MLYESTDNHTNTPPQYNGNISAIRWKTSTDAVREYGHTYDALNRLTKSDYTQLNGTTWSNSTNYDVNSISYDANGNMLTMTQYGKVDPNNYGMIDQLNYTYDGNKVVSINDNVAVNPNRGDFSNGANLATEYVYDANGNMIEDKNKGITILYNYLNLPCKVTFANGNTISYIYNTNGNKERMIIGNTEYSGGIQSTTDYVNGFVYQNNILSFYSNETGRVVKTAGGFQREYIINDHLGNARMTVISEENNEPAITQYDSYYPFGLEMGGLSYVSGTENKYKYNGKEKQDALGLNWYDYGARFYDPQVGRWWVVDALSNEPEQIDKTPYAYGWNNPVNLTDPDGNCPMCIGALVGAATDIAIQSVEIAMDDKKSFSKDFSVESVAVSAVAGATGVGLASKISKLGTVAKIGIELAHDATANAANQYAKDGKVNLKSAALGASGGKIVGDLTKSSISNIVAKSSESKVLGNQANRIARVAAGNPRASRVVAAEMASKKATNYIEKRAVAGATATSNITSNIVSKPFEDKKNK